MYTCMKEQHPTPTVYLVRGVGYFCYKHMLEFEAITGKKDEEV